MFRNLFIVALIIFIEWFDVKYYINPRVQCGMAYTYNITAHCSDGENETKCSGRV